MIGRTLGHYQILEQLGAGGMGVVYKARDTHLDRPVAVKVLPPERVADAERKQRFIREAKAASALNHPNIITIYDIDEADGVLFIAMEYVAGRTLDDLAARRSLKLGEALKYAVQMADALAKAHGAGIVHRDLKPSNVMVNEDGLVKILDFGLAKLTAHDEEEHDAAATRTLGQLTERGAVLGTLFYMSPEQAEGRGIDARSDIFSFGSVLYEMVTGERPFQGETRVSTLAAIVSRDPKPVTGVPHDLEKIIARCLRKNLDRRFQHMDDVKIALLEVKEESDSGKLGPAPAGARPSRRWRWIVPPAVALALMGVYLAGRRTAPESTPAWKVTPLTTDPGHETDPALSPDGNQVAFSRDGDIYVKLIDGGPPLRLTTDPGSDGSPCWSPDGRRVAFLRAGDVLVVPALGGPERRVARFDSRTYGLAWSPDGRFLALGTGSPGGMALVTVESGEIRQLARVERGYDDHPAFSPDGRSLAFTRGLASFTRSLHVLPLGADGAASGPPRSVLKEQLQFGGLDWSPDGRHLLFSALRGARHVLSSVPAAGGLPTQLPIESEDATRPSLARRADRLVYRKYVTDTNVWQIPGPAESVKATPPARLIASTHPDRDPQFSPDSKRIVFTSNRTGNMAIWRADRDGSNQMQLASLGEDRLGSPRWSPDGRWIVFDSYAQGRSDLYLVSSEGGAARRLATDRFDEFRPSFSLDSKWIYFGSGLGASSQIWKMPASGAGAAVQVTRSGGFEPFESPDGKFLYYAKAGTTGGIWRIPLEGGEEILVLPEGRQGLWGVAGDSIYYREPATGERPARILVFRPATGRKTELFRFPEGVQFPFGSTNLAVSPDERTIVYVQIDRDESDLMLVDNFRLR